MYKIESVRIDNFWHRFNATCSFNENVNIIIGRNGTGKTTFMNILFAVLAVDIEGLNDNDFDLVEVKLIANGKRKTIKAKRIDSPFLPFNEMEYQISRKKETIKLITSDDRHLSLRHRRLASEEIKALKKTLSKIVSLSSLSVYRLRNGNDYEVHDKRGTRIVSPVDHRLSELLQELTLYQLELSQKAREVSDALQKEVLISILYCKEDLKKKIVFEKDKEKERLVAAFTQLGVMNPDVKNKINYHVNAVDKSVKTLRKTDQDNKTKNKIEDYQTILSSIEALRKTKKIIDLSLDAESETSDIFSQINLFLTVLMEFIEDKKFEFSGGKLGIISAHDNLDFDGLSSGEKQLLILFIETLLQRKKSFIFLTDEPELSLHIAWQRNIIPAIKRLNPNAQIIAATHSPEVASKYRASIHKMEEIING